MLVLGNMVGCRVAVGVVLQGGCAALLKKVLAFLEGLEGVSEFFKANNPGLLFRELSNGIGLGGQLGKKKIR